MCLSSAAPKSLTASTAGSLKAASLTLTPGLQTMVSFILCFEGIHGGLVFGHNLVLVCLQYHPGPHIHHTGLQSLDRIPQTIVVTQHEIVIQLCVISISVS